MSNANVYQKLESLTEKLSEYQEIMFGRDYYFVPHTAMICMGGSPRFFADFQKGSHGSITYTSEDNTFWSPSLMIAVKNHVEINNVARNLMLMLGNLQKAVETRQLTLNTSHHIYATKAFGSLSPEIFHGIEIGSITHNYDMEDEDDVDYNRPYVIEGLNLKELENNNENTFPAAFFLQCLTGHFDLIDHLVGSGGHIKSVIDSILESDRESGLDTDTTEDVADFFTLHYLDEITERLAGLVASATTEYSNHEAKE